MEDLKNKINSTSVEILCIGSELLLGNILNSNAKWIAEELASLGLPHYQQTVVGDNINRIKYAILQASKRSRILIITGGLGPTYDDLTHEAIGATFNTPLKENKELSKSLKQKIKGNSNSAISSIRKQSSIPIGAKVITNNTGTAPGIIWTPIVNFTILTFPGVPSELKDMWHQDGMNWFKKKSFNKGIIKSKILHFTGISETSLSERIKHLMHKENPTIAPYASLGEVKLRVTAKAENNHTANKLIDPIEKEIISFTKDNYFGHGNDSLASVVINLLRKRGETLALAESCTGGGIGNAISQISGCSDVFLGGIISYNNFIKERLLGVPKNLLLEYGAVSNEVVQSMSHGAKKRFNADWVIAVSGIAGPTGGSIEKPIGLVHFSVTGPDIEVCSKELFGKHKSRNAIQKLSVLKGLDLLRLLLLKTS